MSLTHVCTYVSGPGGEAEAYLKLPHKPIDPLLDLRVLRRPNHSRRGVECMRVPHLRKEGAVHDGAPDGHRLRECVRHTWHSLSVSPDTSLPSPPLHFEGQPSIHTLPPSRRIHNHAPKPPSHQPKALPSKKNPLPKATNPQLKTHPPHRPTTSSTPRFSRRVLNAHWP